MTKLPDIIKNLPPPPYSSRCGERPKWGQERLEVGDAILLYNAPVEKQRIYNTRRAFNLYGRRNNKKFIVSTLEGNLYAWRIA